MAFGDRLHCQLECHNIICRLKCLIITEINLMLRRSHLVMGCLYLKSHVLKRQHHIPSRILAKIDRSKIKISSALVALCRRLSVFILIEQEKFALRSYIEPVSKLCRIRNCFS